METMPVNKLLITMAAPMVLSMLIGALYNVVDSLFVSHYGEKALSVVSLAFQNILSSNAFSILLDILAEEIQILRYWVTSRDSLSEELLVKQYSILLGMFLTE